jgi:ubiquinone/menaquinone biosynthesis C-methylase UbiE
MILGDKTASVARPTVDFDTPATMRVYELLEIPQYLPNGPDRLSAGLDRIVTSQLAKLCAGLPRPERVLDVGCGPASCLWKLDMKPIGLDLCDQYTRRFHEMGDACVTGSAARLPFASDSFDLETLRCVRLD